MATVETLLPSEILQPSVPTLHSLLVGIQNADVRTVIHQIEQLSAYFRSHDNLHPYLAQSPLMPEIMSLVTDHASPMVVSHGLRLLSTALQSSSCSACANIIDRHAANAITGTTVFNRLQDHLASDDKRIQSRAMHLASTLLQHQNSLRLLRRLTWTLRLWRTNHHHTINFVINALSLHTRYMMVTDGAAAAVRNVFFHLAQSKLSDERLLQLFSPLQRSLRLTSPILTQPVLSHITTLYGSCETGSSRAGVVRDLIVSLLSTGPPPHVTIKTALSLNPFTNLDQRQIILDWINDESRCSSSCLKQYLSSLQCAMNPRLSFRYLCNATFMEQLVQRLPASSVMPAALARSNISAALQQKSLLIMALAQRIVLALANHGSKQALAVLPDVQVILRSGSPADNDPLYLCCIRSLMKCGALPSDHAWTMSSSVINTGNALCDLIKADMLCLAPVTISPPVLELQQAADTATDPVIFSRLTALMERHRIPLPQPSSDSVISHERCAKKPKRSGNVVSILTRFNVMRMRFQDDRHGFIQKTVSDRVASDDDLFAAFIVTNDVKDSSVWNNAHAASSSHFRHWLYALVLRRYGATSNIGLEITPWPLLLLCAAALPIQKRLSLCPLTECPISLIRALLPENINPHLLALPTISDYIMTADFDQNVILHLTRRAISSNDAALRAILQSLHGSDSLRFSKALQTLSAEGLEVPYLACDFTFASNQQISNTGLAWYDDVEQLTRLADVEISAMATADCQTLCDLLRSYRATTSELDLKRFNCIETVERCVEVSLFGARFGPTVTSFDTCQEISLEDWLFCLNGLVKSPARWEEADPRFIIPSVLAVLDRTESKFNPSFTDSGLVSFTIARGLTSDSDPLRTCAYTLLHHVYNATGLMSSPAHQVLTLIKNSITVFRDEAPTNEIDTNGENDGTRSESENVDNNNMESDDDHDNDDNEKDCASTDMNDVSNSDTGNHPKTPGDTELPIIPNLSATLWSAMFAVVVSRQGTGHPMFAPICAYMSRRAWIPMPTVPDSLRFENVSFPPSAQLQWLLGVLSRGLISHRDAVSIRRMGLWSKLQVWRPLVKSTTIYWQVFTSGAKLQCSRNDLVYEHAVIPFVHRHLEDEGALEFIHSLADHLSAAPAAIRSQAALLLRDILSRKHNLALATAAKLARVAQPMEFAAILRPLHLQSMLDSSPIDFNSLDLIPLLDHCFIDVGTDSEEQCLAQSLIARLLDNATSISLIKCLSDKIQQIIVPDPSAVTLFAAVRQCQYRLRNSNDDSINAALNHLRNNVCC